MGVAMGGANLNQIKPRRANMHMFYARVEVGKGRRFSW